MRELPRRRILTATAATAAALTAAVVVLGEVLPAATATAIPAHAKAATGAVASAPAGRADALPGPNAAALRAAISGLPDDIATSAQVRVSGTAGSWKGASGVRDLTTGRPVLDNARFRAGSTTKVFTAAVALQLVAEGRLRLDDTVQRLLPGLLPGSYQPVTVGQLLNHTSGIPAAEVGGDTADQIEHRYESRTPRQMIELAGKNRQEFAPGTKQHYLNINYTVLGLLIEHATRRSYEHEVAARILRPLHLKDTSLPGTDPRLKGRHNRGYQVLPDGRGGTRLVDVTEWNMSASWAAGDIISSTADLTRFTTALFAGRVVPKAQLEHMFQVPDVPMYDGDEDPANDARAAYTMGLTRMMKLPTGQWLYGKTGARYGYTTGVAGTRDLQRVVAFSATSKDAKADGQNPLTLKIAAAAFAR